MMNDNKGNIWKWAAALLLLCNIALIAFLWLKPQGKNGPHETPREFVIKNLKLDDAQVKQYDVMIDAHQASMQQLRRESMVLRQVLFANLRGDIDLGSNTDSLAKVIGNNQARIETVTFEHFKQVRSICTAEQKAKFDEIIGDVIRKMNGPGHGGPPPPHDRQGHPGGPGDDMPPPPPGEHGPPPDGR